MGQKGPVWATWAPRKVAQDGGGQRDCQACGEPTPAKNRSVCNDCALLSLEVLHQLAQERMQRIESRRRARLAQLPPQLTEPATYADDGMAWAPEEEDQPAGILDLLGLGLIFIVLFLAAAFAGGAG